MARLSRCAANLLGILSVLVLIQGRAFAEDSSTNERGPVERIEETAKRVGKSIEESVKNTAKKIEEKHIPEKVEEKLKHAAEKTAEVIEKTGKHIEKKLNQ